MDYNDCKHIGIEEYLKADFLWHQLQDTESSTPLTFQWNHSSSYKLLLTSLSIDSENIFHGPRWNSEVPRFAANLQFTPLIPKKAVDLNKSPSDFKFIPMKQSDITKKDFQSVVKNEIKPESENIILLATSRINNVESINLESNETVRDDGEFLSSNFYETTHEKENSSIHDDILNFLPDLSVLEANYIVLHNEIM